MSAEAGAPRHALPYVEPVCAAERAGRQVVRIGDLDALSAAREGLVLA